MRQMGFKVRCACDCHGIGMCGRGGQGAKRLQTKASQGFCEVPPGQGGAVSAR